MDSSPRDQGGTFDPRLKSGILKGKWNEVQILVVLLSRNWGPSQGRELFNLPQPDFFRPKSGRGAQPTLLDIIIQLDTYGGGECLGHHGSRKIQELLITS